MTGQNKTKIPGSTSAESPKKSNLNLSQRASEYATEVVKEQRLKTSILNRYKNIDSMQKAEKIEALDDTRLNPSLIQNPYDALAFSYNQWAKMGKGQAAKLTPEQKERAASQFYDKRLKPIYDALGSTAMPKELWMKKAYDEALKYELSDSYHSSLVQTAISGYSGGMATLDRVAGLTMDMLGSAIKRTSDLLMTSDHPQAPAYFNTVRAMTEGERGENFRERIKKDAESIPIYGYVSKHVGDLAPNDQFWHDVVPMQGFTQKATSAVIEQAMQLPLYVGIGKGVQALGYAGGGIPLVTNLTKVLEATPIGRAVLPLLASGVEGAAVGATLTGEGEDWKREAWQSALGFMAFHTTFGVLGLGAKAGARQIMKLSDAVKGTPAEKGVAKFGEELELGKDGKHILSPSERRDAFKKVFAQYTAASGLQGMLGMFKEAVAVMKDEEGMSKEAVQAARRIRLEADPAHYNPLYNVTSYLSGLVGEGKISEVPKDKMKLLEFYFSRLVNESAAQAPKVVQTMKEGVEKEAEKVAATPVGQKQIKKKMADLKAADAKQGLNANKDDNFYLKRALEWYKQKNAAAAARAIDETTSKPAEEVKAAARKRVDETNPTFEPGEHPAFTKVRSSYKYDEKGNVTGYSLSHSRDWKVYATKQAKAKGFEDIGEWLKDLSTEDFVKDLEDWFYPKQLAEHGLFFEHEAGKQSPNFLAFMYNYKDMMPEEVSEALDYHLQEMDKVEKFLSPSIPYDKQLRYFAVMMHNHVDDFLGAWERFHKKERNIYRSTLSDLLNPTKYQFQLLQERQFTERKNLTSMYSRKPEVQKRVLAIYDKLAEEKLSILAKKRGTVTDRAIEGAEKIKSINKEMGSLLTVTGERVPWEF